MSRYKELMHTFKKELQLLKYADTTINTYSSCLAVFLRAMAGKPKPLPVTEIKNFLITIKNQNYHKQFTATIHHFYKLVLKQHLSRRIAQADAQLTHQLAHHPIIPLKNPSFPHPPIRVSLHA